jgi:hypothetical protein
MAVPAHRIAHRNAERQAVNSVVSTAHIDTGFLYNPIGALTHLLIDVLHIV